MKWKNLPYKFFDMVNLELDIKTIGTETRLRKIGISIPSKIEELTEDQFIKLIDCSYLRNDNQNPSHLINIFTESAIQVFEEVSAESVLLFERAYNKSLNIDFNRFLLKDLKGKKIADPLVLNHTVDALYWGLFYYDNIIKNNYKDESEHFKDLLRLAACFFSDTTKFKTEQTECFCSDFFNEEEFIKVVTFTCNFTLIYRWLEKTFPFAFKVTKANAGLNYFQLLAVQTPDEFKGKPLAESLRRVDLIVKEYLLNGAAAGSKLETILNIAKN